MELSNCLKKISLHFERFFLALFLRQFAHSSYNFVVFSLHVATSGPKGGMKNDGGVVMGKRSAAFRLPGKVNLL